LQGKIPLGSGWRIKNKKWSGTVHSREFKTDSFQNLNLTYLYDNLTIDNCFQLSESVNSLFLIVGYPEYIKPLENFGCPQFELYLNNKKIYTARRLNKTNNWLEETIETKDLTEKNELRLKVTGTEKQFGYINWRIWGME